MAAADDTEQAAVAQKTAPVPVPGADDYDDDCPECRVCRGPEEEGRPLFSPCKCSGSIMHCHQECLLEWLKHSNKDRCELCSHRFDFVPVYAEDAPEFLPPLTFLRVGLRRATTEWIPLAARVVLALVLWLGVVPLVTSWLYRIWIHRSRVFVERLTVASVWGDVVSGLIIAAAIILSFLSLMSFADFLRFHWDVQNIRGDDPAPLVQHPPPQQRANVGGRLHLNRGERNQAAAVVEPLAPPMAALHAPPLIPAADPAVAPAATAAAAAATSDGVQSQAAAVSTPEPLAPRPTPEPDDEVATPAPAIPAPAFPAAGAREVKEEAALVVEGSGGKQTCANDDGGADSKDNHGEDDDGETEVYSGGGSDDEDDDGHSGALQIKLEQLGEDGECHEHDPLADDEAPLRDPDGDDLDGHGDPEHPNLDDDILDDLDNLNDEELAALDDDILDDLDDLGDDELVDVELQVAVDELLGVRGPVVVLLRNLLWLLAFNFAYLGLFAFVPFSIGSSVLVGVRRYATFLASEGPGSAAAAASAAAGTAAAAAAAGAGAGASVFDPRAALEAATAAAAGAATAVLELAPATDGAISTAAAAAAAMAAEGMPPQQEQEGAGGGGLGNGSVVDMLSEISRKAMEEGHTLQLPDLGTIALGYLVVSLMIFMWRAIVRAVCGGGGANARMRLLGKVRLALDCTAAVVKVGILLFLKMLLLPLLLGVCLDAATLSVFVEHTNDSTATGGYSISSDSSHDSDSNGGGFGSSAAITAHDRIAFTAQNLVGSLLLHWVLGITFMLFVTVSVLQLREVLHPDIFAAVIRPQEPHPDLLGSLLQESGATHARRMIMSLAIYMVLLFLFVWLPTNAFKAALPTSLPIHLRLFYWVPQLQVPAELVLFHLSVLAFLERFKNRIGELQHGWLVWACKRLGLTRYLLPLSSQVGVARNVPHTFRNGNDGGAEEKEEGAGDEAAAAAAAGNGDDGNGDDGNGDDGNGNGEVIPEGGGGGGGGILEEDDGEHVGAPLQRPPPGWDDLLGGAQGRWAWGDEPRSPLELGLAPRRRPSHVLPRLLLLSVGCWVSVLALCLVGTSLPLVVGRALAALLHTPRRFNHDPLAFAAGLAFCLAAKGPFLACVAWLSTPRATVAQVKRRLAMATRLPADASTQPPRAAQAREQAAAAAGMGALVVFAVLWLGFLPILVGTLFEVTFVTGAEEWDSKGLAALAPLQDWGLGFVLLHGWAFLAAKGYFHQPDHQPDEHQGEAPIPNAQRQPVGLVGGGGGGAVAEPALAGAGEAPADAPPPPAAHNDQQQEQAGDGGGGAGWGAAGELAGVFPLFPMGQAPFAEGLEVVSWQRRLERAYRLVGAALAEGRWEEAGEDASSLGEALLWDLAIPVIVAWLKAVLVPMAAAFLGALAQRTARAHSLLAPPFSSEDGAPAGAVSAMAAAAAATTAAAPGALAVASPLTMFRHALGTCLFLTLLSALGGPLWACFRTLHDSIRDEQYLVGLELQDFHRPQPNKASEGPAASAAGGESSSSAASSSSSSSAEAAVAAAASTASEMASAAVVSGTGL